jgi:hypothetical protein
MQGVLEQCLSNDWCNMQWLGNAQGQTNKSQFLFSRMLCCLEIIGNELGLFKPNSYYKYWHDLQHTNVYNVHVCWISRQFQTWQIYMHMNWVWRAKCWRGNYKPKDTQHKWARLIFSRWPICLFGPTKSASTICCAVSWPLLGDDKCVGNLDEKVIFVFTQALPLENCRGAKLTLNLWFWVHFKRAFMS